MECNRREARVGQGAETAWWARSGSVPAVKHVSRRVERRVAAPCWILRSWHCSCCNQLHVRYLHRRQHVVTRAEPRKLSRIRSPLLPSNGHHTASLSPRSVFTVGNYMKSPLRNSSLCQVCSHRFTLSPTKTCYTLSSSQRQST